MTHGLSFGGGSTDAAVLEFPEQRKLVDALLAQHSGRLPKNFWEGLSSLGDAIAARVARDRLDRPEADGSTDAASKFSGLIDAIANAPQATPSRSASIFQAHHLAKGMTAKRL